MNGDSAFLALVAEATATLYDALTRIAEGRVTKVDLARTLRRLAT